MSIFIISCYTYTLFWCFSTNEEDSSSDEFSDCDSFSTKKPKNITSSISSDYVSAHSPAVSSISNSASVASVNSPAGSTTSHHLLLETILRKVEHMSNTLDQHTLMLNNVISSSSTSTLSLDRPSDVPNLPIENKAEYKALEEFLKHDEKFNYMVRSLLHTYL